MKRALAIDYGARRIGVAVSGPNGALALPVTTLSRERKSSDRVRRLIRLAAQHDVDGFVLGLPLELDGREGAAAETVRRFAAALRKRSGLPVELVDERLTTVEADEALARMGVRGAQRDALIDQAAAVVILESWTASRQAHERL